MGLLPSSTFTVQNSFVPDKDVHGRNVVLLQSTVLGEVLNITSDT